MKKRVLKLCLSLVVLVGIVSSCDVDNDDNDINFSYALLPVTQVKIPDTLIFNDQYEFKVTYEKPSNCYNFSGFDYSAEGHERKISVISSFVANNDKCTTFDQPKAETRTLNFVVKRKDYYVFKFWQGKDSIGEPKYLTKKAIVMDRK